MLVRRLRISNIKGLHARASARLVEVAERFDARAIVRKDGQETGADSIMGLLMLAASCGSEVEVEATGPEAEALMEAIAALIADKFGEGD